MNLFTNFKKISLLIILLASQDVSSGILSFMDDISSAVDKQLSDRGIKPYIIPMDQGRLVSHEKFQEIDVGLSKEQVIYLLGKPSISSPFIDNQWDYVYFNNTNTSEAKKLSVHFKNEKVFEILINDKTFKKLNLEEFSDISLDNAPLSDEDKNIQRKYGPIVVDIENNKLSSKIIDVCNINDFKTFQDVKTLNDADESTLEIRADNQSQTEEEFTAKGNAEAERVNDFLKEDNIVYDTQAQDLAAKGNVKYFNQDISIYSKNATYKNNIDEINFSKAKYYKSDKSAAGNAEEVFIKKNTHLNYKD